MTNETVTNPSPKEVLSDQSKKLMDTLVAKKTELGLNFCAQVGRDPSHRVVILRQPVLEEKPVYWGKNDDGSEWQKNCRVARYIIATPNGLMAAQFIREVQHEEGDDFVQYAGEDGEATGNNEAGFNLHLKYAEEGPPGGPFDGNDGFFPTVSGEIQIALNGPTFRKTLNSDVTPEEFSQALQSSVEASRAPVPKTDIEKEIGTLSQALDAVSSFQF